jgi:hypothetical protein
MHAWQDKKRGSTLMTYLKDEMHSRVNKANKKETKPAGHGNS